MTRRIYIVSKGSKPEDVTETALAKNCPEIAWGIPPMLEHYVSEDSLPVVYEEPAPSTPSVVTIQDRLQALEKKVKVLEDARHG